MKDRWISTMDGTSVPSEEESVERKMDRDEGQLPVSSPREALVPAACRDEQRVELGSAQHQVLLCASKLGLKCFETQCKLLSILKGRPHAFRMFPWYVRPFNLLYEPKSTFSKG